MESNTLALAMWRKHSVSDCNFRD